MAPAIGLPASSATTPLMVSPLPVPTVTFAAAMVRPPFMSVAVQRTRYTPLLIQLFVAVVRSLASGSAIPVPKGLIPERNGASGSSNSQK